MGSVWAISWHQAEGELHFQGTIPADTAARLSLPAAPGQEEILLNGKRLRGTPAGTRLLLDLAPGDFAGTLTFAQTPSVSLIRVTPATDY